MQNVYALTNNKTDILFNLRFKLIMFWVHNLLSKNNFLKIEVHYICSCIL